MPATLVLTVDDSLIHKVDRHNVENLFSMWTVFSRCAGSLEEGCRLENLSWRLWNRETFCCDPASEANATTPATSSARNSEGRFAAEVPDLSTTDHHSTSNLLDISRPQIRRQDSASSQSRRGRERHITPDELEKMVSAIKGNKDLKPLNFSISPLRALAEETQPQQCATPPLPEASTVDEVLVVASATSAPRISSKPTSGTSQRSATSVVRGFSPAHVSSSYRSIPLLSAPSSIFSADIVAADDQRPTALRKTSVSAPSSSTDDSSNEQADSVAKPTLLRKKSPVFTFGGSSNEEDTSLPNRSPPKSALTESFQRPPKKQTSFREEVATRTIHEEQPFYDDVFESDDDIDESAIDDDDDSSDWEDSNEDSGHASIDDRTFFQRVDSRPILTSRRSLLTIMLNDRVTALPTATSKSASALRRSPRASPNRPSLAASVESDDESALMMKSGGLKPVSEHPRLGNARTPAQRIARAVTTPHQLALSPRTTRRNMLGTELTVSLRQNLLREHQQKSQTANAILKRRYTAHDTADLKQYSKNAAHADKDDTDENASWSGYFSTGLGEYHSKGW